MNAGDHGDLIKVVARINIALAGYTDKKVSEWIPSLAGRRYHIYLPNDADGKVMCEKIDDLKCLLSAYFLTDLRPRHIIDFSYANPTGNRWVNLIFGNASFPVEYDPSQEVEPKFTDSVRVMDLNAFNYPNKEIKDNYPTESLEKNYLALKQNVNLLNKVELIRDSFMRFNEAISFAIHAKEAELVMGTVVLVAALEGLLLKPYGNYKVRRFISVASRLYNQNVEEEYFEADDGWMHKLTPEQAEDVFKSIYKIRSDMVHGTLETILSQKEEWVRLAAIFRINLNDINPSARAHQYAHVMTHLCYHVGLMLHSSIDTLIQGPAEKVFEQDP